MTSADSPQSITGQPYADVQAASSPYLWRLLEVVRLASREFLAINPPRLIAGTILLRMILQALFFTLLGGVIAGARHQEYAFIGALAMALSMSNILYVSQVPLVDKEYGTFWRLRIGCVHPIVVFAVRALPYPLVGFAVLVTGAAIVAPLTGLTDLALQLVPLAGIFVLISFTATASGLAAAAFAVGRRAEVLVSNLMAYGLLLCSGAFLPPGRAPVLDSIGAILPARHGLAAIHSHREGEAWLHHLLAEAVVGVAWLAAAAAIVMVQIRRARRHGHDDFD